MTQQSPQKFPEIMKHWFYVSILNAVALVVWSFQLYQIGFPVREVMLNDSDSLGYIAVGHWLFGGPITPLISIRTFLFPLWLTCIIGVFGLKGFFVSQSLLWLASVNLLHQSMIKLRLPQLISLPVSVIFCFNLTLLAISYEVLTETATVFLGCLFMYCAVNCESVQQLKERVGSLLFISMLMMLLKPLFEPLFFIFLATLVFFIFKEQDSKQKKKKLRWLLVSLLPVFIQLFIMVRFAGVFSLSGIADLNWRDYFISNTLSRVQHIDIKNAREIVAGWSTVQTIQFAAHHVWELSNSYFHNLHLNISSFPNHVSAIGSPSFEVSFMIWWNRFHWLAQLALPFLLIFSWKKIRRQSLNAWRVIIIALPMYDVLLLTSISFGQGDRLVIPAIPFAVVLYAILIRTYLPAGRGFAMSESK